jgi:hypothetical protein
MPCRHRSVLLNLEVRPVGRACKWKHNARHRVAKGDLRLVVGESGPASGEQGYCAPCGLAMLAVARDALEQHVESLEGNGGAN